MIALAAFWATFVFLTKAALSAFGAGLALLVFGATCGYFSFRNIRSMRA